MDQLGGVDAAKDDYHEKVATYTAAAAVAADRQQRAAEAQQQVLAQKLTDAKARYGDETPATIGRATDSIINGEGVHLVVKEIVGESVAAGIGVDVLYVLGSKPEELASFIELAKSNPGAAIRKFVLLEDLTKQELPRAPESDGRGRRRNHRARRERQVRFD